MHSAYTHILSMSVDIQNGLADIAAMFKQFDGEKDGKLFHSEFISMMMALYPNG